MLVRLCENFLALPFCRDEEFLATSNQRAWFDLANLDYTEMTLTHNDLEDDYQTYT